MSDMLVMPTAQGWVPMPRPNIARRVAGRRLDEIAPVDREGVAEAHQGLNEATARCAQWGDPLLVPEGNYRMGGPWLIHEGTQAVLHPFARIIGYFNSTGAGALVQAAPGYVETYDPAANVLRYIRITGGRFLRDGEISGTNRETWTGNQGNVIGFWALDCRLTDVWIEQYAGGRAIMPRGGKWQLDGITMWNPRQPDGLVSNTDGGTGGIRPTVIRELICTRAKGVTFDDTYQAVPGQTDESSSAIVYWGCWGRSLGARLCVVGLGAAAPVAGSITEITFARIRGEGVQTINCDNNNSTGKVEVLLHDVKVRILNTMPHHTNNDATNPVFALTGSSDEDGAEFEVTLRDCAALNVHSCALQIGGRSVTKALVDGFKSPAPTLAGGTRAPVEIVDGDHIVMRNFEVAGGGDLNALNPMVLGSASAGTVVRKIVLEDGKITGVPAGGAAIFCANNGVLDLTVSRVTPTPHPGVNADAVRCSDIADLVTIRDCDFSAMDTSPISNPPANLFLDNVRINGTTYLYQLAAATTLLPWDGRSNLIRMTATGPTSIEAVVIPAGWALRGRVPVLYIHCASPQTITFVHNAAGGNLSLAGAANLAATQNGVLTLILDVFNNRWRQAAFTQG